MTTIRFPAQLLNLRTYERGLIFYSQSELDDWANRHSSGGPGDGEDFENWLRKWHDCGLVEPAFSEE